MAPRLPRVCFQNLKAHFGGCAAPDTVQCRGRGNVESPGLRLTGRKGFGRLLQSFSAGLLLLRGKGDSVRCTRMLVELNEITSSARVLSRNEFAFYPVCQDGQTAGRDGVQPQML